LRKKAGGDALALPCDRKDPQISLKVLTNLAGFRFFLAGVGSRLAGIGEASITQGFGSVRCEKRQAGSPSLCLDFQ